MNSYSDLAEFLSLLTYAKEEHKGSSELPDIPKSTPFNAWKTNDWKAATEAVKGFHQRLMRQDANATLEDLEKDGEDDEQNFDTANHESFNKAFYKILKFFTFHNYLAPFRKTLEEHSAAIPTATKEAFEPLVISDEFLKSYR